MYALVKFAHKYLDQSRIQFNFKNQRSIPICYFTSYILLSASILYSYLKTYSFNVKLFSLSQNDMQLRGFLEDENPSFIIITLTQFLNMVELKKLVPYLHKKNLKVFIGGVPFSYDERLKKDFPNCYFPQNIEDLALTLIRTINEGKF